MNFHVQLGLLSIALFPLFSCSKDKAEDDSTPVIEAAAPSPVLPQPSPEPPQIDAPIVDPDANSGATMSPLPATGVPLGFTSWDEFNSLDPETRSLRILDGNDPSQELIGEDPRCSVYILAAFLNEKGEASYVLRTSFKHNNQSHGWIMVTPEKSSTRVIGTGSNGQDQIFLELAQAGDLPSATRMNLKWFHINHFDTGVCEKLNSRTKS
jgi:hypothetical protein